ncbi:uncharacterized mitochondrial protein AtMg00860-like [Henckelia pumila]|uniref:uncharacterized mitochondrial protein AtMg00860-like n=1 Tax=Henckelia pumila TaxID=405737 RepID=UPI003C6E5747
MPFGLTNTPATFQSAMNGVLRPFFRKFVLFFFDDILIYSRHLEDHMSHLRAVLAYLKARQFYAKLNKCSFAQPVVYYLGHKIDAQGLSPEPTKIEAVQSWPNPQTLKELRGFLGLTGYYRKFDKNYADIAAPLTSFLQKDKFVWSSSAERAFKALKQTMTSLPILALPNFALPFSIHTDASGLAIGASNKVADALSRRPGEEGTNELIMI